MLAVVLGLLLSAGLWWAYFGADDDEQAERALTEAPPRRQPWIALEGFGVAHYFLLLGVVLAAAGIKKAIGHAYDPLETAQALVLGGGVALFLAADVAFRRVLGLGRSLHRAVAALLALATIPLGSEVAAVAQLAALVVVLAAALAGEGTPLDAGWGDVPGLARRRITAGGSPWPRSRRGRFASERRAVTHGRPAGRTAGQHSATPPCVDCWGSTAGAKKRHAPARPAPGIARARHAAGREPSAQARATAR